MFMFTSVGVIRYLLSVDVSFVLYLTFIVGTYFIMVASKRIKDGKKDTTYNFGGSWI